MRINWTLLAALLLLLNACGETREPMPRPTGWPRIELPPHAYKLFQQPGFPLTFEYADFAQVESVNPDSLWTDLYYPPFECRMHITYRRVPGSGKSRDEHTEEYRALAFKHIQKVNIREKELKGPGGWGTLYELYGNVGVPAQMVFGDSLNLFMASVYFDTAIRSDSLEPVINFMKDDLHHVTQTLKWGPLPVNSAAH